MSNRLGFREWLQSCTAIPHLYFQPPANVRMHYPCIRYSLARAETGHADNHPYRISRYYEAVLIDTDPDSKYVQRILETPKCRLDRTYAADGLNHWVFSVHYTGTHPETDS